MYAEVFVKCTPAPAKRNGESVKQTINQMAQGIKKKKLSLNVLCFMEYFLHLLSFYMFIHVSFHLVIFFI